MSTTPPTLPGGPRTATVAFVGAGPGDPGLLTLAAVAALGQAAVVITDQVTRDAAVLAHAPAEVEVVDASHGSHGQALTQASRAKLLVSRAKAHPGALVVRLMDGDPTVFNGFAEEALACVKAGIPFDVIPGVSAATAVPAYAGIPLTSAGVSAVHVLDAGDKGADLAHAVDSATSVVLLGTAKELSRSLSTLLSAGRDAATPVALTERGTTTRQRTTTTVLGDAPETVAALEFPTLAVVGPTVQLRDQLSWFEAKPLFGWSVLVPRTKEQAGGTGELLGAQGAAAHVVPTISVEPPRTPHQMERATKGLVTGRYEWIGFTSVNAVKAIRERIEGLGLDARVFAGVKVAAVGGASAQALRDWGITPDLVPTEEFSASGLLAVWPAYDEEVDPINRVFLPRADIATDTLVAGLRDLGWEVEDVTAYRTVRAAPPAQEVRDAIKGGDFDAVVFTSSSTVRNLVGIAGKPHTSTVVACIGPATAKTAEEHGLRVDVLAAEATVSALVDGLAEYGRGLARAAAATGEPVRKPSDRRRTPGRRRAR